LSFLRGVIRKDGSLDCGTIGNSLVGADALAIRLFAVEEVGNEFDDTRQQVEPPTKTISWMFGLVNLGVAEDLLNRSRVPQTDSGKAL
jgi:hypothetical protein